MTDRNNKWILHLQIVRNGGNDPEGARIPSDTEDEARNAFEVLKGQLSMMQNVTAWIERPDGGDDIKL